VLCQYCHDFHLRKDLINNLCPVVYPLAKKLQEKNSYKCKNCNGEGSYLERVETIRYEGTKMYEARVKEWAESLRDPSNDPLPKP
jgi:hypothetical protein